MEAIKALLTSNENQIVDLIDAYGFCNITPCGDSIKFAFDDESKGSCVIKTDTLQYTRWSNNTHGDIVTAIMHKMNFSFKEAVFDIKTKLGLSTNSNIVLVSKPTRKSIFSILKDNLKMIKGTFEYTQYDINKYQPIISTMFRRDNIFLNTQCMFDIRYDKETDRIVIFWKDINGKIVGNTARANWEIAKDYPYKYLSLMPFNKKNYLFGLYENKEYIKKSGYCVLFEAEKSTMQCHSFGFRSCASVGSSHVDKLQVELLYNLGIRNIILAYDEDKHIIEYLKVKGDIAEWYPDMNVYALYDREKQYLKLGSKKSPSDLGLEVFQNLFNKIQKI